MNLDNAYRRFVFVQADATATFDGVVAGWLELAEEYDPGTPKALLEGDFLAFIPDGTCFREVSYKREHRAIEQAMSPWSRSAGRCVARVSADKFVLHDGHQYALNEVKFVRAK